MWMAVKHVSKVVAEPARVLNLLENSRPIERVGALRKHMQVVSTVLRWSLQVWPSQNWMRVPSEDKLQTIKIKNGRYFVTARGA